MQIITKDFIQRTEGYVFGSMAVAAIVVIYLPFRALLNSTPVALSLLLAVLYIATRYGSAPAVFSSIAAMLCFNFFFLPPYHTFALADPQNWIALAVFLFTSIIAGSLSARARHRAQIAEAQKQQIENLYTELQHAFKKASQAEALEQSEKLKSALLEAVSHDLRTPLTSMKAAVTTLLAEAESRNTLQLDEHGKKELLEIVRDEIDRLNHFIASLIDLAKIEAGGMEPRRNWVHLEEVFSNALDRSAALTKGFRIRVDQDPHIPPLRIDEKTIAEVLYILIENATKYSPAGTEILLNARLSTPDHLVIRVEDHGTGIPPELRQRVFEKFFSVSNDSSGHSRSRRGLGMGLAIARAIVEAHGGKIWIEDTPSGPGTSVVFVLPLMKPAVTVNPIPEVRA